MLQISRNLKLYFATVGLAVLWVGVWGFFIPEQVDKALPWLVPPLHARFIGAIYLSCIILMGGSIMARRYAEVRTAVFMIAIWTSELFVISLMYLNEFNFSRAPAWFWSVAYIIFPLIGLWLTWVHRNERDQSVNSSLPNWIRIYFFAQGLIVTMLALALLFAPEFMVNVWPWKVTRMLIQMYSGPFLAYGLGSLMLSRQRTWLEVRLVAMASFALAVGVLIASAIHRTLFSASTISTWIWFGGFSLAALLLGAVILRGRNDAVDSK